MRTKPCYEPVNWEWGRMWLVVRYMGWEYPIVRLKAYERNLNKARFRQFRRDPLEHAVELPYSDYIQRWDELFDWIDRRTCGWNFVIERNKAIRFSFSEPTVAVEFRLRWS